MKKLVIPALVMFAVCLIGCKKNHNCNCQTTNYYDGNFYSNSGSSLAYRSSMTKKQVKASCDLTQQSINNATSGSQGVGKSGTNTGFSSKTTCVVE